LKRKDSLLLCVDEKARVFQFSPSSGCKAGMDSIKIRLLFDIAMQTQRHNQLLQTTFLPELDTQSLKALQLRTAEELDVNVVFRDRLSDGSEGPEMLVIPAGGFEMGSPRDEFGHSQEESPQRYVTLKQPFALGRYTVTANEFERYSRSVNRRWRSDLIRTKGHFPVINISWYEAIAFADWLSSETGQSYRLPSEQEWEYAARAGSSGPFAFGDNVSCREVHFNSAFPYVEGRNQRRWFWPRCMPLNRALQVGSLPANFWGLHEMHGNVWEMTSSPWTDYHGTVQVSEVASEWVVTKGGSWFDPAARARSAARAPRLRHELDVNLGFRLLRELHQ
jgi:formylglycine-generating enzyme required for sulfatase activity